MKNMKILVHIKIIIKCCYLCEFCYIVSTYVHTKIDLSFNLMLLHSVKAYHYAEFFIPLKWYYTPLHTYRTMKLFLHFPFIIPPRRQWRRGVTYTLLARGHPTCIIILILCDFSLQSLVHWQ